MKPVKNRTCQPCTGCCDGWVQMVIHGVPVHPGKPCPHSTGTGCSDYANRPHSPCVTFKCGWVIDNSPLPDWMKPNEGKVIVVFNMFQWRGLPVNVAVPIGEKIPKKSLDWLKKFSEDNRLPLFFTEQILEDGKFQVQQKATAYGPPAFQQDMLKLQQEGWTPW